MEDACFTSLFEGFLPLSASQYSSRLWETYSTLHILMVKSVGSGKTALQKERQEEHLRMFQSGSE